MQEQKYSQIKLVSPKGIRQKYKTWNENEDRRTNIETAATSKSSKDSKYTRTQQNKKKIPKRAPLTSLTTQVKDLNQKILAKDGRHRRCLDRVKKCKQNWTFQNDERKFYQKVTGEYTRTSQQPAAKETKNNFGVKYGNGKNITEMLNE